MNKNVVHIFGPYFLFPNGKMSSENLFQLEMFGVCEWKEKSLDRKRQKTKMLHFYLDLLSVHQTDVQMDMSNKQLGIWDFQQGEMLNLEG